jgi:hypothetical protein
VESFAHVLGASHDAGWHFALSVMTMSKAARSALRCGRATPPMPRHCCQVIERGRAKFRVRELCVVADRGMLSEATLSALGRRTLRSITSSGCACAAPKRSPRWCSKAMRPGSKSPASAKGPEEFSGVARGERAALIYDQREGKRVFEIDNWCLLRRE